MYVCVCLFVTTIKAKALRKINQKANKAIVSISAMYSSLLGVLITNM